MWINPYDLQYNTYEFGRYKQGRIIHIPTGNYVDWSTDRLNPSEWRARQNALEELTKKLYGDITWT